MRLTRVLAPASAIACLTLTTLPAAADPAAFLGLTVAFGAGSGAKAGVTAKILSSDQEEEWVAAAGVSYFFTPSDNWGFDLSAGYNFESFSVLGGYDLLQRAPVASFGWADTQEEAAPAPLPPA